jgi:colanic acid/amylovoran biosynthesis glycosyltransferase
VPWFISFYGADVYEIGRLEEWRRRYAPMFEAAARVLALGPVMGETLASIGCPREKIRVHPLGVDTMDLPLRPRTRAPGEPLRVLFAGTFREKKGIRYLLEAASLAAARGAQIELDLVGDAAGKAGDSEVKAEVLQMAGELRLAAPVRHHPFVKFKDLVDMALGAHLFVAPSITGADGDSEGTPFVLQQMMSTGMACVSTVHADIPYLFGEHRAMLVPERDSTAIADWLVQYWERPELMTEHGMALARQIRTHFDAHACAATLSDLYDEALADIILTAAAHPVST